jgi:hypothetical protein
MLRQQSDSTILFLVFLCNNRENASIKYSQNVIDLHLLLRSQAAGETEDSQHRNPLKEEAKDAEEVQEVTTNLDHAGRRG